MTGEARRGRHAWTFLTSHAHVLLAVAADADTRVGDIAARVGVTERQVLSILRDLEAEGYLHRSRQGRRTHYALQPSMPFRHPSSAGHQVAELLAIFRDGHAVHGAGGRQRPGAKG